jgi:hypothetical protein
MATINNIPIDPSQVTREWLKTVLKVSVTSELSFENMGQLRVDVCSKIRYRQIIFDRNFTSGS